MRIAFVWNTLPCTGMQSSLRRAPAPSKLITGKTFQSGRNRRNRGLPCSFVALETPNQILNRFRLGQSAVFIIGAYDKGITVFSQQVRALNLAWALIEDGEVNLDTECDLKAVRSDPFRKQIAVVGAGFAGLTIAAGLFKKGVNADITVFEQRDTVLPLQHGSDTRWLHPHIYDWPQLGSEAFSAALPVLNWTANRASDVVVQILNEWRNLFAWPQEQPKKTRSGPPSIKVYCNTSYLQISECAATSDTVDDFPLTIEWIGEERKWCEPAVPEDGKPSPKGTSQGFHIVVLAVGFGLETGTRNSYWRNETLAQPHLGEARSTYIVSGAGDGALIDLCRLRIAQFRQDRILAELFHDRPRLVARLREIHQSREEGLGEIPTVWQDDFDGADEVLGLLRKRLRQDTTVILRVLQPSFTKLFTNQQVSFQNRLLAYLLYRCGAFTLVGGKKDNSDLDQLAQEHGVPKERIIIRHGTQKKEGFARILPKRLGDEVVEYIDEPSPHHQTDAACWPGGYFDMPGMRQHRDPGYRPTEQMRRYWRKEYLPSPTEALAAAFCSAVAGFLIEATQPSSRLRVTLHRRLISSDETVLQQCCAYHGFHVRRPGQAGRTFPSSTGTIGAAFTLQSIVYTRRNATKLKLSEDMKKMRLSPEAQKISSEVASVAAIPLLGEAVDSAAKDPVVLAVLYVDSYDRNAFVEATLLKLVGMCEQFLQSLLEVARPPGSIANTDFWRHSKSNEKEQQAPNPDDWKALRLADIAAPHTERLGYLNFDFSDFTPVEQA